MALQMSMAFRAPAPLAHRRVAASAVMRTSAVLSRPAALQSQFVRPACSLHSLCSSFSGLRLGISASPAVAAPSRRGMSIVARGGNSMGNTKGGTRRHRTRTSGFRARRLTPGGRHVLKNRRNKGRKVLAPGSYRK